MAPGRRLIIFQCPRNMNQFLSLACVTCPWDMSTYLHSVSKPTVCHGAWRLTIYFHVPGTWISSCSWRASYVPGTYRHICILYQNFPYVMAPGWRMIIFPCPRNSNLFLFLACVICAWDMSTHLHSVSQPPVCHGAWIETYNISLSPGYELVPVHGKRDMSLGLMSTHLHSVSNSSVGHGDWLYFHVPGIWISSCAWHAWYVPDPWGISTHLHSVKKTVCYSAWMETDYISMSPEYELVPVHGTGDMSLGHVDTFTFCIKTPRMSWRLDRDW